MSYIAKTSVPGEQIIVVGRIHWIIYARGFILFGIASQLVLTAVALTNDSEVAIGCLLAAPVVFFFAISLLLSRLIYVWTTEIAVTDRRVIYKTGLIRRHTAEMNMGRIESVRVDQTILGRILGYGTVIVRGTGAGLEDLHPIADPLTFRSAMTAISLDR